MITLDGTTLCVSVFSHKYAYLQQIYRTKLPLSVDTPHERHRDLRIFQAQTLLPYHQLVCLDFTSRIPDGRGQPRSK